MKKVYPQVFVVAHTVMDEPGLQQYLTEIGAPEWRTDAVDGEKLIEVAGRACYRSWKPGLNPNVTKIREGNKKYIGNLLQQKHGSVLEHVSISFIFHNVSRVFTHELVRHRVGTAMSQESLRYVRSNELSAFLPLPELEEPLKEIEAIYQRCLDIPANASFDEKKQLTSAFRRLLPQGMAATILWTANLRTIREVLEKRTSLGAEIEMRVVFDEVGHIVSKLYPHVFQDFIRNEQGEWLPKNSRV